LCVYGIARDLSCAGLGTLKELERSFLQENFDSKIKLSVEDKNCPVFSFREIRNLNNKESPKWLKDRLLSIGVNPRNALVDIGNYVMFCFNTPLHCYDATKIEEKIVLYPAKDGEEFVDLFNKKHLLKNGNTVIADKKKSICLAGVIGAESSGSSIDTTNVIVECAIFDPINTARTGRQLNLQTDARYRYERGSDHNMIQFALDYTCKLITEICGGEISKTIRYEEENYKKSIEKTLELPLYRVEKLLGLKIEESVIMDILTKNGYKINRKKDILCLDVPSWKNNIMVREDIIDEIIRFYGYEHLRDDGFEKNDIYEQEGNLYFKKLDEKLHQTRKKLVNNGVFEIISYAFTKRKDNEFFTKTNDKLELLNPIISDLSYMRQNILINLINIIKNNNNRSLENLSFFEIGNLFTTNNIDQERIVIGGVRSGNNKDKNIYKDSRKFDIYDVKKDLFDAIGIFKIDASKLLINKNVPDYYHVNRSGAVIMGKTVLGYFGELHPKILKEFDVKQKIVAFELFIDNLPKKMIMGDNERKSYIPNDFQPIERSFSFIIKQEIGVGDIIKSVSSLEKELISDVKLFDIYQEENNKTEKSIAFTVIIQPTNKTLNKEEIDSISDKIVGMIRTSYGGKLKDGKE
jgi:phenylalanyl-tRNA synthetase beta chain